MKKVKKVAVWVIGALAVLITTLLGYVKLALPNVGPAPEMKIEITPERVTRGAYLANHVTVCIDCHSTRDWSKFSGPPVEGTYGKGGETFDEKQGFPGTFYAPNITPEGISRYTDGELFRLITTGVTKEGNAIFPIMPYRYYGQMDPEDIASIIAYLRTLNPIENDVPKSVVGFPMNFLINTMPQKANFSKIPPKTDIVNYGKYLVNAAGCVECHTQADRGKLLEDMKFAGGREFDLGGPVLRSSNISPDKETGLGAWTEEAFLNIFRERSDSTVLHKVLKPGEFNSIMPWVMYGNMEEADLKAIYAYLQTLPPIKNAVQVFTPAANSEQAAKY